MEAKYIPANKKALYIVIVLLVSYLFYVLNIESIVNHILLFKFKLIEINLVVSAQLAETKLFIQTILLAAPSIIFFIYLSWICYLVIDSKAIPPKQMSFPFSMHQLLGKEALFLGYIGLIVSILQIFVNIYEIYEIFELVN